MKNLGVRMGYNAEEEEEGMMRAAENSFSEESEN
jgi:hypothetical protein